MKIETNQPWSTDNIAANLGLSVRDEKDRCLNFKLDY